MQIQCNLKPLGQAVGVRTFIELCSNMLQIINRQLMCFFALKVAFLHICIIVTDNCPNLANTCQKTRRPKLLKSDYFVGPSLALKTARRCGCKKHHLSFYLAFLALCAVVQSRP